MMKLKQRKSEIEEKILLRKIFVKLKDTQSLIIFSYFLLLRQKKILI